MAGNVSMSGGKIRTPVGSAPVVPLALVAVGGYLLWFSSHYWASTKADGSTLWPSDPVKAVLQGKSLPPVVRGPSAGAVLSTETATVSAAEQQAAQAQIAAQQGVTPSTGQANPNALIQAIAGGAGLGPAIAADAQRYVGAGYVWGGNASRIGDWDCSSFTSYVLGHDLGLDLPGGTWAQVTANGTQHGPTTLSYMTFGQAIDRSQVGPGDLIVSAVHMGIAISNSTMVSAEDAASGTGLGSFPGGFPGGTPVYRRVT